MVNFKKPGLRTIKTALSILIAIIPFYIFGDESPFYAALGALMSTQGSVYSSYRVGKFRVIGTCIGAAFGMIMAGFFQLNLVATFLGVILVIYIVNLLKLQGGTTLAVIAFLYTMTHSIEPMHYYFTRILQTIVGVIIGVSVNYFICPPKLHIRVQKTSIDLAKDILNSLENYIKREEKFNIERFHENFNSYKTALKDYEIEIKSSRTNLLHYERMTNLHDIFHRVIGHCIILNNLNKECLLNKENYDNLKKYFTDIGELDIKKTNDFDEYNYNIKCLINEVSELIDVTTDKTYHYK